MAADNSASPPAVDYSDAIIRWARIAVTAVLIPIGWSAFHDPYGSVPVLSDIITAVHEAGHMLFMPFGDTMYVLGGSLFQVLLPLVFVGYFLRGRRDLHAAMVCLWWAAIAALQVSIYMADARARRLMLITGGTGDETDAHDWYHLFAKWHVLRLDTKIAGDLRVLAALACIVAIGVGLIAAWNAGRASGSGDAAAGSAPAA